MEFDIAIIGGGIVGAATFYQLQKKNPTLKIALFEKENILAKHQTGHNSGVLHSGLYYKPGSLKAKNCIEGKREMIAFAKEKQFGKYRVSDATEAGATGAAEFAGIAAGKFKLRVS